MSSPRWRTATRASRDRPFSYTRFVRENQYCAFGDSICHAHAQLRRYQAGLEVPVLVGVDGQQTIDLLAAGQPVPPPLLARGLLDTGSDVAAVAPWILRKLAISSEAKLLRTLPAVR